jgi:hypothetical protein
MNETMRVWLIVIGWTGKSPHAITGLQLQVSVEISYKFEDERKDIPKKSFGHLYLSTYFLVNP